MTLKHFGTDGIRGEYGGSALNDEIAFRAGVAAARLLKRDKENNSPLLVVGRDTRGSGPLLLAALKSGFESEGGKVQSIGVAPTPAIAKVVALGEADMGCALTSSHNPSSDNGLKFFSGMGTKLSEDSEYALDSEVDLVASPEASAFPVAGDDAAQAVEAYVDAVASAFPAMYLKGKRIAIDCANGALSGIAVNMLERFGAEVYAVGISPNGTNINDGVGSECPDSIGNLYGNDNYDLGFAFDGDGDRMIAFDENGIKLAGEATLGLLAIHSQSMGELKQGVLVTTIQSNLGLDVALSEKGISVKRVDIGDKFISRLMVADGYNVGGEESGHVVLGDFSMTGDGLFAAMKVALAVVESGQSLSELSSFYRAFPQATRAIRVSQKPPIENCPQISRTIKDIEESFGSQGRLLVRYSGTEPKIRLLVEADSDTKTMGAISQLEQAVKEDLE